VIQYERPDGVLLTFGGQTALNCGVALDSSGIFEKYGVEILGTPIQAITITEDRQLFAEKMASIQEKVSPSIAVYNVQEVKIYVAKNGKITLFIFFSKRLLTLLRNLATQFLHVLPTHSVDWALALPTTRLNSLPWRSKRLHIPSS
jgi:hypothetical protein